MNLINSEKKDSGEAVLRIEITAQELDAAVNKAYLKNRTRIGVPGFRKGKAPRKIIEKMYGVAVFMNDALEILIPDVIDFAVTDTKLDIAGRPKVTDIDLKNNDTTAEITLEVALKPEVKLAKYKGLSAPKPEINISGSEIMSEVEAIRERNARLESAERPAAMGDIAFIDFEGFLGGEAFEGGKGDNYELELGSGRFIPGFEEKIVGMKVSDERDIDLVFPENYKEELAGKDVTFKVKLLDLKEKQLPELDDEFAKDVSEFDTLDEYKASIREKLEKGRQAEIDEVFENALLEQIIESMESVIPEAMVEEQLENNMHNLSHRLSSYGMQPSQYLQMTGLNSDEFKEKMRENSLKQVKTMLALEEIAKLENIEISEDEIEEEYKRAAEEYKTDLPKIKETVSRDVIVQELKSRAAVKIVIDSAKVEKPVKTEKPAKTGKKSEKGESK